MNAAAAGRQGLTLGLLLAVGANALASLAVVTIAPRIPAELGRLDLYGGVFAANFLASILASVWGGAAADRWGLRAPFALGLALFAAGLAGAAAAPSMPFVIAARALQGFGGGLLVICVYVAVTGAFADHERPRVMALISSAWVIPALVGPALAGALATWAGWRAVFWALLPVVAAVAALTLPRLPRGAPAADAGRGAPWRDVARIARGAGPLIVARAGLFTAFVGFEAFMALMLTDVLGLSSAATGAVIAAGSVGWTSGSWWQARRDAAAPARRAQRMAFGVATLGVGLALQGVALGLATGSPIVAPAAAVLGWMIAGLGIGIAHATSSVLAFAWSEQAAVGAGRVSTALQLADNLGAAVATAAGGAALALVAGRLGEAALREGVAAAFAVGGTAWCLSYLAARRNARPAPAAPGRP